MEAIGMESGAIVKRSPYFCSGCPHNRSTRIPEGSLSMTGIGCHTMANFVNPTAALLPTQMGGEGGNWLGLASFTRTRHVFQNMGDGTYFHSGLLAIRAAIAARVNITYKILYNDAVAMTGGQPVDGPISVASIAQQVRHEGVGIIVILSDDPARYRDLPVCEGCGDCSAQSTCVSLLPLQTEVGTKRRIDQASCNKDYSCLNGFCPSFITLEGAEPRRPEVARVDPALLAELPAPNPSPPLQDTLNLMLAGIGGTGVITVAAIIGMAAHIDGLAVSSFDMTGLAQKNGAVYSHVRIARSPGQLFAQRLGRGEADLLLAFDLVAALGDDAAMTLRRGRTSAIVNSDVSSTSAFQFDRGATIDPKTLLARLGQHIGAAAVQAVEAVSLITTLLGDGLAANLFLVGVAVQRALLPVTASAIERAVLLNATAVGLNLKAFRLGRLFAARPGVVQAMTRNDSPARASPEPQPLEDIIAARAAHLMEYQDAAYAERYRKLVERVRLAEESVTPGSPHLTTTVARTYAKLLAYKDEYEVARLLTSPALQAELKQNFAAGAHLSFNLAPPILAGKGADGRPRKRTYSAAFMSPMLRVLARLKLLRGSALDPFGRTKERRIERALIVHYEALVESVLSRLTAANRRAATELLAQADQVRGFGPVKERAVESYYSRVAQLEDAFQRALLL